jgi:hypothetical protein
VEFLFAFVWTLRSDFHSDAIFAHNVCHAHRSADVETRWPPRML